MRYVLRHIFIFLFILELGMLAMVFKPVTEARADTRISSSVAKAVSSRDDIMVTRFPNAAERQIRTRKLMRDLSAGADATGLSDALDNVRAYVTEQAKAMIVSAPAGNL